MIVRADDVSLPRKCVLVVDHEGNMQSDQNSAESRPKLRALPSQATPRNRAKSFITIRRFVHPPV
jgi:hypothetical protein